MLIFVSKIIEKIEKKILNGFKYWYNNNKKYWAANQHIAMISEGPCDTEDWSNDAENLALITRINYILKYI